MNQKDINNEQGLINKNLEPTKCFCGSTDFYDKITVTMEYQVLEKDRYCKNCNKIIGCWCYGHWML